MEHLVLAFACIVLIALLQADASRDGPRLENLSETEVKYALIYWDYNTTERVVPSVRRDGDDGLRQVKLGYQFVLPLPERLAGLLYVGHAARLRLALERARRGEALRVGAVGGSITAGQAVGGALHTYAQTFVHWLNAALPPLPPGKRPTRRQHRKLTWDGSSDGGGDDGGLNEGLPWDDGEKDGASDGFSNQEDGLVTGDLGSALAQSWLRTRSGELEGPRQERAPRKALQLRQRHQHRHQHQHQHQERRAQRVEHQEQSAVETQEDDRQGVQGGEYFDRRRRLFQMPMENLLDSLQRVQQPQPQPRRLRDKRPGRAWSGRARAGRLLLRAGARVSTAAAAAPGLPARRVLPGRTPYHEYLNGAVPGTESGYASSCLDHHLPQDVDIVFVEYTVNDPPAPSWGFTTPERRALERLVRKLLNRPSRPAVVVVNMFAIEAAKGRYLHTPERDFNELATYYGLPAVSLKAAVMPPASTESGQAATPEVSLGAIFNGGVHHPGRGGHVVVAEVLITLVMELLQSNSQLDLGPTGYRDGAAAPQSGLDPDLQRALQAVAARPLPRPLAAGNYEAGSNTCYLVEGLKGLAVTPVEGWEWTDEGRGKWGWVALEKGQQLRIKLSTQLAGNRSEKASSAPVVVQVAYLQSYSGMGTAKVVCESGCECEPTLVDGFHTRLVSITNMADVEVTQHSECVMLLTPQGPSPTARDAEAAAAKDAAKDAAGQDGGGTGTEVHISGGNKFKLMGVVVGEEPGASEGTVTWVRPETFETSQLLHQGGGGPGGRGGGSGGRGDQG